MAFRGPAIFSNDPNIGIRQMGLDAFIPTPVSSITYKSRAGVDARRRQNYQNAPTKRRPGPPHEVVTLPDGNKVSILLRGKKGKKQPSTMFPGASVPKPGQFGYGGPTPVARPTPVAQPNIPITGKPSAAKIADGIVELEKEAGKSSFAPSIMLFDDPYQYRVKGGGTWNSYNSIDAMDAPSRALYEQKKKLMNAGATDLPSDMFLGGAMGA